MSSISRNGKDNFETNRVYIDIFDETVVLICYIFILISSSIDITFDNAITILTKSSIKFVKFVKVCQRSTHKCADTKLSSYYKRRAFYLVQYNSIKNKYITIK